MLHAVTRLHKTSALLVAAALLAMVSTAACSDDSPANSADSNGRDTGSGSGVIDDRIFTRTGDTFSMDDLELVGFKKSKEFETETLEGASEAWYGFFDQRDIEVWVYASHEDAVNNGVPIAETVIAREAGQTDPSIPVVNRYPAFAVVGNLMMLCERQLATCEALIDQLP